MTIVSIQTLMAMSINGYDMYIVNIKAASHFWTQRDEKSVCITGPLWGNLPMYSKHKGPVIRSSVVFVASLKKKTTVIQTVEFN